MTKVDRSLAKWHKSSRSTGGGNCVEVAENLPGVVLIRDTKQQERGPVLEIAPSAWGAFLEDVKGGRFDLA